MSSFFLFSFGLPDLMMAGAAIAAMLCGVILMGGRSIVGRPLRMISSLYARRAQRVVLAKNSQAEPLRKDMLRQEMRGVQRAA
jgi:hypothetical protein